MAHNSPSLLRQISISPMLLLIIIFMTIAIHPSYGYDDHHKSDLHDLSQRELLVKICGQTSDSKFCMDNIYVSDPRIPSEAQTAKEICVSALHFAQNRAKEVQSYIETLLGNSSGSAVKLQPQERQNLGVCQVLNFVAIVHLKSAMEKVTANIRIDQGPVVEDLNFASNCSDTCHSFVQQTSFADQLNKIGLVPKFCEIAVVSTGYFKN